MRHNQDPSQMTRRDALMAAGLFGVGALLSACAGPGKSSRVELPTTPHAAPLPIKPTKEAKFAPHPTWEQDFTKMPDGKLDSRYWTIDTGNVIPGYNNEVQTLTDRPENVRIQDGLLVIQARKELLNGKDYTSGHVNTQDKFSFQQGKLEVDLRAPQGVGTWPAAWLLPNAANATWPLDGEIDFFESVGAQPGQVFPDVHTYNTEAAHQNNTKPLAVPNMADEFNTYGVELTPGKVAFTFNGENYHSVEQTSQDHRSWPFNQSYYLILNLAMGGSWGGEASQQYPPDGIQGDGPWDMAVRGVRYYDLAS